MILIIFAIFSERETIRCNISSKKCGKDYFSISSLKIKRSNLVFRTEGEEESWPVLCLFLPRVTRRRISRIRQRVLNRQRFKYILVNINFYKRLPSFTIPIYGIWTLPKASSFCSVHNSRTWYYRLCTRSIGNLIFLKLSNHNSVETIFDFFKSSTINSVWTRRSNESTEMFFFYLIKRFLFSEELNLCHIRPKKCRQEKQQHKLQR